MPCRSSAIQAAGDEVEPGHNAKRGRVLRVPRRGERGGEEASSRGDSAVGEQALPGAVQGRRLPVPSTILLLPRYGAGRQAVRHRA
jgi:hypothetical protein